MDDLLLLQKSFEAFLDVHPETKDEVRETIIEFLLGIIEEVGEVSKEIATQSKKWHQFTEADSIDSVTRESIDIFIYVLAIWTILGINENKIKQFYFEKIAWNISRAFRKTKTQQQLISILNGEGTQSELWAMNFLKTHTQEENKEKLVTMILEEKLRVK